MTATCSSALARPSGYCCSSRARSASRWSGPDEVQRALRRAPELVPDFIALRGDPSDGLPGRARDRSQDGGRAAHPLRLAGGGHRRRGSASGPRVAAALTDNADELRAFARDRHAAARGGRGRPDAGDRSRRAAPPRRASWGCGAWPSVWRRASGLGDLVGAVSPSRGIYGALGREAHGDHVAVSDHVVAALEAQRAALAGAGVAAGVRRARPRRPPRRGQSPSGCRSGSARPRATPTGRGAGARTGPAWPRRR